MQHNIRAQMALLATSPNYGVLLGALIVPPVNIVAGKDSHDQQGSVLKDTTALEVLGLQLRHLGTKTGISATRVWIKVKLLTTTAVHPVITAWKGLPRQSAVPQAQ
jgi:hypothetical protein